MLARGKGKPDRVILDILITLNQEKERHDIDGLYEGRFRSHAENFEIETEMAGIDWNARSKKVEDVRTFGNEHVEKEDEISTTEPSVKNEEEVVVTTLVTEQEQIQMHRSVIKAAAIKAASDKVPVTAPPPHMPPRTEDEVDIDSMTVNDLRKELRKRQLSTVGRKADLQARIRKHFAEERKLRNAWATTNITTVKEAASGQTNLVKISDDSEQSAVHKKDFNEVDVVMEDATESTAVDKNDLGQVATEPTSKKTDMTSSKARDPSLESEEMAEEVTHPITFQPSTALKKQPPKSALKPSKYNSSIIESTPQHGGANPKAVPVPGSLPTDHPKSAAFLAKISDSSTDIINNSTFLPASVNGKQLQSNLSKTETSSGRIMKTPDGLAFKTTKTGGSGSAMLLEKKRAHSAATEARKARLAEMRQKCGQPNAASSSFAAEPPLSHSTFAGSSTLKKMASSSTLGESKPNSILIKMREKAAAEKNIENAMVAPAKPSGTVKHISSTNPASISTENQVARPTMAKWPTALKCILDPANKPTASEPKPSPKKQEEKPLSPMQTYEMSDREEDSDSESESDGDENQRPKKSIPDWAQKANLIRALERQYSDGINRLDPDKIFGEVLTCNLEEIFDKKKARYKKRTSSGNWTKDHVTLSEKLTYKRTMGYDQK